MKRSTKNLAQSGFTLIEVMLVLAIIGAVLAFGMPRLRGNKANIRTVLRELSILTREVRNTARMKNRTYRLVFKNDGKMTTYWAEYSEGAVFAPSQQSLEKEKAKLSMDKESQPKSTFTKDEKILKKDRELPKGLNVVLVDTDRDSSPAASRESMIYFSPEGLVEKSAIQISDGKNLTWTLIVNPLTGHSDIIEKAALLKDVTKDEE